MKNFALLIFLLLFSKSYAQSQSNSSNVVEAYVDLVTWFNPHLGNAYLHYPFLGSGNVSDYTVDHNSIYSYQTTTQTESNDIYLYHIKSIFHHVERCDTSLMIICKDHVYGYPKGAAKRIGMKDKDSTYVHTHSFPLADKIQNCNHIDAINDSTFYYAENDWTFIITPTHRALITGNKDDLWNVDIQLNSKGLPIKVSRGNGTEVYEYIAFDRFNNWLTKKVTQYDGSSYTITRDIKYSCEKCGGKGFYEDFCKRCHGTGTCRPNPKGGPDESVGICPMCGGKRSMRYKIKCKECMK